MNTFTIFLAVCFLLAPFGCTSTSYQAEENSFPFIYNEQEYSILSRSLSPGNSVNYLLLRERGQFVLRARDNDIDGVLDTLLEGNLSLENANAIYAYGISKAVDDGKYRQYQPARIYYQRTEEGYYAIQSFESAPTEWTNTFIIYNATESAEIRIIDQGADGTLDKFEIGNGDLDASQALYSRILEEGILAGQIMRGSGLFIVEVPQ